MLDLMKTGGVTGWLAAAALCDTAHVPLSSHLFHETSAHLMPLVAQPGYLEYIRLAEPILAHPLRPHSGCLTATSEPGNGISWDEDAIARYLLTT